MQSKNCNLKTCFSLASTKAINYDNFTQIVKFGFIVFFLVLVCHDFYVN